MNRLIAALTPADRDALSLHLKVERFGPGTILHAAGDRVEVAFFPIDAMVAHSAAQDDGPAIETGTVGREGVVSAVAIIGDGTAFETAAVHVGGEMAVVPLPAVHDLFDRSAPFRRLLGAYVQAYVAQVAQSVVCNASHPTEARLSRWLLTCADRTDRDAAIPLGNGLLAEMLGVGRPAAAVATGLLQTAGLIRATRDGIVILDRGALEEASCDCYGRVRRAFERLLPASYS